MECIKLNIFDLNVNENYIYPILGLFGIAITYFGNKFIKPTLFIGGTLISTTSSYKLTEFILQKIKHENCDILYITTILMSISGGFIALKLYKLMNFILGFCTGGSFGYLMYISWLQNFCLGVYFIYDNMFWLCISIPGIFCGIVTHYKEKELSMILTSLIGPILVIIPIKELFEKKNIIKDDNFLNYFIYILLYSLLSLTGLYIQNKRYKNNKKEHINYQPYQISYN